MKRIMLIAAGIALAGGIAATPAVAGLAGNPSFSHEIPVPVPRMKARIASSDSPTSSAPDISRSNHGPTTGWRRSDASCA